MSAVSVNSVDLEAARKLTAEVRRDTLLQHAQRGLLSGTATEPLRRQLRVMNDGSDVGIDDAIQQARKSVDGLSFDYELKHPSNLLEASFEQPAYVVDQLIPRGEVTLFGAHGGAGKTALSLAIAAHVATGTQFAGHNVAKGRVLFVTLEDSFSVLNAKLGRIAASQKLETSDVERHVTILDLSVGDVTLAEEAFSEISRTKQLEKTPALRKLEEVADGQSLIVIDNASDAFSGNENERRHVRRFVKNFLGGIARSSHAGMLLLAHIDKNAARYGSNNNSYTGSTAWHNSARSRLALSAETEGRVKLVHEKSNRGPKADDAWFRWNDSGVLEPIQLAPESELAFDSAPVLSALRQAWAALESVPTARSGPRTAFHVLRPHGLPEDFSKDRLWGVIEHLNSTGEIKAEDYTDGSRNRRQRWVAP